MPIVKDVDGTRKFISCLDCGGPCHLQECHESPFSALRRLRILDLRPANPASPDTGFLVKVEMEVLMLPDAFEKSGIRFDGTPVDVSAFITVRPSKAEPTNRKKNYIMADKPKLWKE